MNRNEAMRDALKYIVSLLRSDTFVVLNPPAVEIIAKILLASEAALAAPQRNCDIPSVCADPHKAYLDDEKNWDEWGSPKLEIQDWLLAPAEKGADA